MSILDDLSKILKVDSGRMYKFIENSHQQLVNSFRKSFNECREIASRMRGFKEVLFVGMGSSATAGEIVASIIEEEASIPARVQRNYELPRWLREDALIIAVSKSGNTFETIKCVKEAAERRLKVVSVFCGGILEELSEKLGIPSIKVDSTPYSRTTTFSLVGGILPLFIEDIPYLERKVEEASRKMNELIEENGLNKPTRENELKRGAEAIMNKEIIVLTTHRFRVSGLRLIQQLNENSKLGAYYSYLPEASHNFIMQEVDSRNAVVVIHSALEDEVTSRLMKIFNDHFSKRGCKLLDLTGLGESYTSQLLTTILAGDYLSYYLAVLRNVDPCETPMLNKIREEMSVYLRGEGVA